MFSDQGKPISNDHINDHINHLHLATIKVLLQCANRKFVEERVDWLLPWHDDGRVGVSYTWLVPLNRWVFLLNITTLGKSSHFSILRKPDVSPKEVRHQLKTVASLRSTACRILEVWKNTEMVWYDKYHVGTVQDSRLSSTTKWSVEYHRLHTVAGCKILHQLVTIGN